MGQERIQTKLTNTTIMKRLFTFVALCAATLSLTGCFGENYEVRARKWICDHVDHYVNLDKETPSLYYFDHDVASDGCTLVKVDLKTMQEEPIHAVVCEDNVRYEFADGVEGYIIPEDKGYTGQSTSFAITCHSGDFLAFTLNYAYAFSYNTKTQRAKLICNGTYVDVHGTLIACCYKPGILGQVINDVVVYDADGNKLVPQRYHGTIARQDVTVELVEKDGNLAGSYYYNKYGPSNRIYIYGTVDQYHNFMISGFNAELYNCETWEGTFGNGVMNGEFTNEYNGKSYAFTLTKMVE